MSYNWDAFQEESDGLKYLSSLSHETGSLFKPTVELFPQYFLQQSSPNSEGVSQVPTLETINEIVRETQVFIDECRIPSTTQGIDAHKEISSLYEFDTENVKLQKEIHLFLEESKRFNYLYSTEMKAWIKDQENDTPTSDGLGKSANDALTAVKHVEKLLKSVSKLNEAVKILTPGKDTASSASSSRSLRSNWLRSLSLALEIEVQEVERERWELSKIVPHN